MSEAVREEASTLTQIVEAALLAAGRPLTLAQIGALFEDHERPGRDELLAAVDAVRTACAGRGFELVEVASGYRFQVREPLGPWVGRLWQERPQRYSRALLETLALIAYRQPITRGEIEEIRGVAVSSTIIKTLQERDWIRVVGHRDVPGRPAMYATSRQFLDYFNLRSLDQLPALADIRDLETLNAELGFGDLPLQAVAQNPEQAQPLAESGASDARGAVAEMGSSDDSGAPLQDANASTAPADDAQADDSRAAKGGDTAGAGSAATTDGESDGQVRQEG